MKIYDQVVCNVCGISSKESKDSVFIQAIKGGESVDICTACIPSVVHGSGAVVHLNAQVAKDLGLKE